MTASGDRERTRAQTTDLWLNACLPKVLDAVRQIDPGVFGLFPDRVGRRWKIGIRKCADRDAVMLGPQVKMPINRTAAGGTEMEADLPTCLGVPRIDFFRTFYSDLGLAEVYP
jgi:hypothetical protein